MDPTRLQHLLIFERASTVIQDDGSPSTSWTEFARTRAELTESKIAEEQAERGTISTETLTFRARHVSVIALADRVIYSEQAFDIVELAEIGRREGLMIKVRRTGP